MMNKSCGLKEINGRKYRCFFELTLGIIGGKWKPVILYQLAINGIMRFGELKRAINGITERMLTKQLRELESDGIIKRKVYRQVPPKVEYSLEETGVDLIPVLLKMREWGVKYEKLISESGISGEEYEGEKCPEISEYYQKNI